jgi:phosphoribosylanthranilate isomerase
MFIKICGITRTDDALHAIEHGATALGFVFWPRSPRYIAPERAADIVVALPAGVMTVGVFVNEMVDNVRDTATRVRLSTVQLHGDEPPEFADRIDWPVLRSVTLDDAADVCDAWSPETTLLLDASDRKRRGGTGTVVDWTQASALAQRRRIVLAGGLTPENVAHAIEEVHPFGVDVSSGVEDAPGVKDPDKVARFLANARAAFERRVRKDPPYANAPH